MRIVYLKILGIIGIVFYLCKNVIEKNLISDVVDFINEEFEKIEISNLQIEIVILITIIVLIFSFYTILNKCYSKKLTFSVKKSLIIFEEIVNYAFIYVIIISVLSIILEGGLRYISLILLVVFIIEMNKEIQYKNYKYNGIIKLDNNEKIKEKIKSFRELQMDGDAILMHAPRGNGKTIFIKEYMFYNRHKFKSITYITLDNTKFDDIKMKFEESAKNKTYLFIKSQLFKYDFNKSEYMRNRLLIVDSIDRVKELDIDEKIKLIYYKNTLVEPDNKNDQMKKEINNLFNKWNDLINIFDKIVIEEGMRENQNKLVLVTNKVVNNMNEYDFENKKQFKLDVEEIFKKKNNSKISYDNYMYELECTKEEFESRLSNGLMHKEFFWDLYDLGIKNYRFISKESKIIDSIVSNINSYFNNNYFNDDKINNKKENELLGLVLLNFKLFIHAYYFRKTAQYRYNNPNYTIGYQYYDIDKLYENIFENIYDDNIKVVKGLRIITKINKEVKIVRDKFLFSNLFLDKEEGRDYYINLDRNKHNEKIYNILIEEIDNVTGFQRLVFKNLIINKELEKLNNQEEKWLKEENLLNTIKSLEIKSNLKEIINLMKENLVLANKFLQGNEFLIYDGKQVLGRPNNFHEVKYSDDYNIAGLIKAALNLIFKVIKKDKITLFELEDIKFNYVRMIYKMYLKNNIIGKINVNKVYNDYDQSMISQKVKEEYVQEFSEFVEFPKNK